ncbi:MAG TPA: PTS sugar transporter subunit IIA [Bellilinea sp.]|jgi:transcriptional antiterminator/mannitol/fructose-specific phosphotransferase system IIA component (Ntr-type)|nr:PTS sugar transporter subunit IIA [Bellilinea sp.]
MSSIKININARQRCIIFALLQSPVHMTLSSLAKETGLTPRIIRYNLEAVKAWFREEGVKLNSRPGFGLEIDATKQERKRLMAKVSQSTEDNLILTRGQRQRITLFDLLNSETSLTYQGLAANGGISRSTVIHDVADIQKWLNVYHLRLERIQNKGARIVGLEQDRRYAMLNLIHEELGERKWYSLWFSPDLKVLMDKSLPPTLERYLKGLPIAYCHTTVQHIEHLVGDRMALYSRIELLMYLAISIDALRKSKTITALEISSLPAGIKTEVSRSIFYEIVRKFSLTFLEKESQMLSVVLFSSKWQEDAVTNTHDLRSVLGEQPVRYAQSIVEYCSNLLHPLLRVDEELLSGLAVHLKPVIYRIRYGLPIVNSSLDDVCQKYPEVFRTAKAGVAAMEMDLGHPVQDEEIGFISMYLAAALSRLRTRDKNSHSVIVLGDGIRAKATFLKARLEYEFPTLHVVEVLSDLPEVMERLNNAELVLSLIPTEIPNLPVLTVSPFLTSAEKRTIQAWITEKEEQNRRQYAISSRKPDLVDVFLPQNITFRQSVNSWRDAVRLASQPLVQGGMIQPEYTQAMIKIIEDYGPYMILSPGVILLHARPVDGVNEVCLSVLLLEKGINFSEDSGPIDVAFVLGALDDTHHLNVLSQLTSLIYQPEFVDALRKSSKPSDVLRAVWNCANPLDSAVPAVN